MARKYSKRASSKVKKAMHERKQGTLRSGRSGKKVNSRKQAIAIGLSQARRAGAKMPKQKSSRKKATKHKSSKKKVSRESVGLSAAAVNAEPTAWPQARAINMPKARHKYISSKPQDLLAD